MPDTAFIELIEPAEIYLEVFSNCKEATITLNSNTNNINAVNWTNGDVTNSITVYTPQKVAAQITDENGCVNFDSAFVDIVTFEVESVDYIFNEADCWKDGSVSVSQITTNYGSIGMNYNLRNKINNAVVDDLSNIPGGLHVLEVVNSDDCNSTLEDEIIIKQKCLEDYPVFSPNYDGIADEYFIPYNGSVSIFDKNGILLTEFDNPSYWNGNDSNGKLLPMGTYLIVTDTGRPVNITLIR